MASEINEPTTEEIARLQEEIDRLNGRSPVGSNAGKLAVIAGFVSIATVVAVILLLIFNPGKDNTQSIVLILAFMLPTVNGIRTMQSNETEKASNSLYTKMLQEVRTSAEAKEALVGADALTQALQELERLKGQKAGIQEERDDQRGRDQKEG